MPTRNFEFYRQRRFSSQLAIFFQRIFILRDKQTCKTLQIRFCGLSGSEQPAMAVSPIRMQLISQKCDWGQDMQNIQALMREKTLAHRRHFQWRTATTHLPHSRQRTTFWNTGMNLNDFWNYFLQPWLTVSWNDGNMPTDKTKFPATYSDIIKLYNQTSI